MCRDWLSQRIQKVSRWRTYYWLATDHGSSLNAEQSELDQALVKTDSAFKHDLTTTVARVNFGDHSFVLKRFNARSLAHKFKRAFRRSRARHCWTMSYRYQVAGLNVAEPILMYERRIGPIRAEAYFVNRFLCGKELLSLLPEMSGPQQAEVVAAIYHAFEKMRTHRLSHGDMKASNLLWVSGELFFVDLDASRKHLTSLGWQAAHRKDKKRFLKNWQKHPNLLQLFTQL